jgi:N-succinyldiaminopimelate aminotransferase
MPAIANRVAAFSTTIFTQINQLAAAHGAVNLGQGAPDFPPPPFVMAALERALSTPHHQYAPGPGYPELQAAIATHAERFYGQTLQEPGRQVLLTTGATEGIFATMQGLLNPGDEVIVFEPFYDSYIPSILFAGGIPRYIPLRAPDWRFDPDELRALFTPKTRMIIINTPHNPTGKVYDRAELELIAQLCQTYDALAMTDEVYEHILFDEAQHLRLATLPGMEDRTITLSSLGKTFSTTGWKIGWAIGHPDLITGIWRARQFMSFAVASVLQWAAIEILQHTPSDYLPSLGASYQAKRDYLSGALAATPLKPLHAEGGYFLMADTSALGLADDRACAEYLIQELGVATIPPSAFYCAEHKPLAAHLLRFSLCKTDQTLAAAVARLQHLKGQTHV